MQTISEEEWVLAICQEVSRYHAMLPDKGLRSIFFGGGTPSLMTPKAVETILLHVDQLWQSTGGLAGVEITMEANPSSVEAERFKGYRQAGVNRLSLGIQSLRDDHLKTLGRKHNVASALKALDIAMNTFSRVSFDLIYARPQQTLEEWESELTEALALGTSHLSLYQLTIEQGTAFAPMHARGDLVLPVEDECLKMYELTDTLTSKAGLFSYEVSNYAKVGQECQHNLVYWNYEEYIGVGPGAHGRLLVSDFKESQNVQRLATQHIKAPQLWLKAVQEKANGEQHLNVLTVQEQFQEQLMMGLRLRKGIEKHGLIRQPSAQEEERIKLLTKQGFIVDNQQSLQLTPQGRLVLNSLLNFIIG